MKKKLACPECKKKSDVVYRKIKDEIVVKKIEGKEYYEVKCNECHFEWYIER